LKSILIEHSTVKSISDQLNSKTHHGYDIDNSTIKSSIFSNSNGSMMSSQLYIKQLEDKLEKEHQDKERMEKEMKELKA
jgi:hypothetical protein